IRMPLYRSQSSQRRIPPPEPVSLSREILERIERVREYHQASKHTYEQVQAAQQTALLDWDNKPSAYRTFPGHPRTLLPTTIVDASVPALQLLADGLGAIPASQLQPPQNLKTLASWLYLADGITIENGVAEDCEFGDCESVQAMIVWADPAAKPLVLAPRAAASAVATGLRAASGSSAGSGAPVDVDPLAGLSSSGIFGSLPGELGQTF